MINIKNRQGMQKMMTAGQRLAPLFQLLRDVIKPGVTTAAIDQFIEQYLAKQGMRSCTKGYMGYKHASCISIGDEVVHGVPSVSRLVKEQDLVKVDVCASYDDYCADMARPFHMGAIPAEVQKFIDVAVTALNKGIARAVSDGRLTDISAAVQKEVESHGYGIVRDFAGHGIGKKMHEDPEILNYGKPGLGPTLKPGMAFAIEPMITMGKYEVVVLKDGWTAATKDHSLAMHIEDTVIITEHGPQVTTRLEHENKR